MVQLEDTSVDLQLSALPSLLSRSAWHCWVVGSGQVQAAWGWGILGYLLVSLPPVIYFFFLNLKLLLKAPAVGLTCSGETLGHKSPSPALLACRDTCRCVPTGMFSTCSHLAGPAEFLPARLRAL